MATREYRLSEFNDDDPPPGRPLQLLCEDNSGTYLLPFKCEWRDGGPLFARRPTTRPTPLALTIKPDLELMLLAAQQARQKAENMLRAQSA